MRFPIRLLASAILFTYAAASASGAGPSTTTVDFASPKQTVAGFGASITWIAGDINQFSAAQQTDILNKLYSTTQPSAGLSYVRGGTFLCEFNPAPGVYNWSHSLIQDEMAWMNRVKAQYGVTRFLASTWTPPAWMKDNNSCSGGHLLPTYYPALAGTQVQWLQSARTSLGLDVAVASVQNEPNLSTSYDSAVYTPQELTDYLVNHLRPAVQTAGLSTKLMVPEGSVYGGASFFDSNWGHPLLDNPTSRAAIDIVGTHGYGVSDMSEPSQTCLQYGKPIWQTEDMDSRGRFTESITDALSWGTEIAGALNTGNFSAWFYWRATTIYNDNGGLIFVDLTAHTYRIPKRVYAIGHFSRFMRPGSVVVSASSTDSGLKLAAVRSATGTAVVVLLNSTKTAKTTNIVLQNLATLPASVTPYRTSATENQLALSPIAVTGNTITMTVPAQSIVTVVGN
jgi:glucuronoarabinoxylan endo-1,4-beta-xylanase